jgi:hypothetical protein
VQLRQERRLAAICGQADPVILVQETQHLGCVPADLIVNGRQGLSWRSQGRVWVAHDLHQFNCRRRWFRWEDSAYPLLVPDFPRDIDVWMRDVRDPAEKAAEGRRILTAGGATASYQIAQLPTGEWAISIETRLKCVTGMSIPWRVLPTREEAVAYFLEEARKFFEREKTLKKGLAQNRTKMLELLSGKDSLFGWQEPEPANA